MLIFFWNGTPTFFCFLGVPRHGEHGATTEKIKNDFIWRRPDFYSRYGWCPNFGKFLFSLNDSWWVTHSYTSNYTSTAPYTTPDLTTLSLIQFESYLLKNDSVWIQSTVIDSMLTFRISFFISTFDLLFHFLWPVAFIFIYNICPYRSFT